MLNVWSVSHDMTSYNGHLGHFELNFASYVDRAEFLNHNFSISVRERCCYMRFLIWKPECLAMVVHHVFDFRSPIQISLIEYNMIGYCLTWQVM